MSRLSYLAFCVTLVVMFREIGSHPQCLTYNVAPSKLERGLYFCPSYDSEYGCCNDRRDWQISIRNKQIVKSFNLEKKSKCTKMLGEILCLECHPYAAHIFASEGNAKFDITSATPGLCSDFCQEFFQECSDVVQNYFWKTGKWIPKNNASYALKGSSDISKDDFCRSIALPDIDYCYPSVQKLDKSILGRRDTQKTNNARICAELVASSLRNPLAAMHAGDGSNRLFVAEQLGEVHVFVNATRPFKEPFLDIKDKVLTTANYGDERGFLSLAFHPNYSTNGRVFVYYSAVSDGGVNATKSKWEHTTVLSEFRVSAENPNRMNHSSEKIVLEVNQPAPNHNGGHLLFGTDGYLYLSLGDGSFRGDPFGSIGNGLNRSTLLGSIIRIDVDTTNSSPYGIPPDNPFVHTTGVRPEIYAYGARNMWRCSVDRGDKETQEGRGRMFCGDVGQNQYEEIDIITKGGNYGWRAYEGYSCYDKQLCEGKLVANAVPPIFAYNHSEGKSVVGGYVYRGTKSPRLYGKYLLADTWSGKLFLLTEDKKTGKWKDEALYLGGEKHCKGGLVGKIPRFILSFGEDEQGEVYILATDFPDTENNAGKVYRLVELESNVSSGSNYWKVPTKTLLVLMILTVKVAFVGVNIML